MRWAWLVVGLVACCPTTMVPDVLPDNGFVPFTPNRPVGVSTVADLSFNEASTRGSRGSATGVADPSAPVSAPGVFRFVYPAGDGKGFGTGLQRVNLPNGTVRVYTAAVVKFSENFVMHPVGIKFWYFYQQTPTGRLGSLVLGLGRSRNATLSSGFMRLVADPQRATGVAKADVPWLVRGKWVRMEMLAVMNTVAGTADGVLQVWVDGELVINNHNMIFSKDPASMTWTESNLDPYYGGNWPGHIIPADQYLYVDHALVASSTVR